MVSTSESPESSLMEGGGKANDAPQDYTKLRGLAALRIAAEKTKIAVDRQEAMKAQVSHHLLHSLILKHDGKHPASDAMISEDLTPGESSALSKLLEESKNPDWLNPGHSSLSLISKQKTKTPPTIQPQLVAAVPPVVKRALPTMPSMAAMPAMPAMPPLPAMPPPLNTKRSDNAAVNDKVAAVEKFALSHVGVTKEEYAKMKPLIEKSIRNNNGQIPAALPTGLTSTSTSLPDKTVRISEKAEAAHSVDAIDKSVDKVLFKSGNILSALGAKLDDPTKSKDPMGTLQSNSDGIVKKIQALQELHSKKLQEVKKALPRHAPHAAQLVTSNKPAASVSALHDDSSSTNDAVAVDNMVKAAKKEARAEIAKHRTQNDILNALHKASQAVALPKAGSIKSKTRKQATLTDPKQIFALASLKKAVLERQKEDFELTSPRAKVARKEEAKMLPAKKIVRAKAPLKQMGVKQEIHQLSSVQLKRLVAAEKQRKQAKLQMEKTKTHVEELNNTELKALVSAAKKAEGL